MKKPKNKPAQESTYEIPRPPAEVFSYTETVQTQMLSENQPMSLLERIECGPEGFRAYIVGAKYPKKGFVFPEAVYDINLAKKSLKQFLVFPTRRALNAFCLTAGYAMQRSFLKNEFLMPVSKELKHVLDTICYELDLDLTFSRILSHIIEYDDAYRFRLQDILSETTQLKLLKRPIREVLRLRKIYLEREHGRERGGGVAVKILPLFTVLALALCVPKFRRAIKYAIESCDFSRLQYDAGDLYWVGFYDGYDFLGVKLKDRMDDQRPKVIVRKNAA